MFCTFIKVNNRYCKYNIIQSFKKVGEAQSCNLSTDNGKLSILYALTIYASKVFKKSFSFYFCIFQKKHFPQAKM